MLIEEWLNNNDLSLSIWNNKYRNGEEDFQEWITRVSAGDERVQKLILEKKFIFGGRILANRGITDRKVTYSNCYVIEAPEDNIESIFECASKLARTFSYGGGCGIDISKLRPRGAVINNAAKESSGAVSFMDIFSQVTGTISQQGRRGALMISIDINHPDVEEFIDCKTDLSRVNFANISVRMNDEFMKAVENDDDYILRWPCNMRHVNTDLHEYNELYSGKKYGYCKRIKAKDLFNKLVKNNWNYAEPGILYWDKISNYNLLANDSSFEYAGTNPCAEEPLPAGGSCLLGSINLAEFVNNGVLNYDDLEHTTAIAIEALNEVLLAGMDLHPLEEQRKSVHDWRQIGLGTMGLADMLIKLGVTYGSQESLEILDNVYKVIAVTAVETSIQLAKTNGCYPNCNKDLLAESPFIKALNLPVADIDDIRKYGMFNSQLLTCAPTGSIGTMLQCSTGVEPIFAMKYTRTTKSLEDHDVKFDVYTKIAADWLANNPGKSLPAYFVESKDITPIQRVAVQSTLQKWIDASISSTTNLPHEATEQDVFNIYMEAWKAGCKGITIYRAGCAREGILTTSSSSEEKPLETKENTLPRGFIIKADDNCIGLKRTLITGCGTLHCEAFFNPITGDLVETYFSKGSKGGCNNFMIGLSRMISLACRGGVKLENILDQLKSCGTCPSYAVRHAVKGDTSIGSCCPVAIGNALRDMHAEVLTRIECCEHTDISYSTKIESASSITEEFSECPECHKMTLVHEGGCTTCLSCGYSKCN